MSHTLKEISILIIEDNPADQWLLKDQLSETNLNIVDIVSKKIYLIKFSGKWQKHLYLLFQVKKSITKLQFTIILYPRIWYALG